jgi:hypothetical protein
MTAGRCRRNAEFVEPIISPERKSIVADLLEADGIIRHDCDKLRREVEKLL